MLRNIRPFVSLPVMLQENSVSHKNAYRALWLHVQVLYHLARISHCNAIGRNGPCDNASCTDGSVPSDGHTGQKYRTATDPHIIFYPYRQCIGDTEFIALSRIIPYPFVRIGGMRCGIYLHIRGYQYVISYLYAVVVDESAVHIYNYPVTDKDIFPVFTMEVDIHMHIFSYGAQHLTQDFPASFRIGIIGGIQFYQKAFRFQGHLHQFGIAAVKRFSRYAFLIFCFHFSYRNVIDAF